jgi:DNA-directed RNA polymerase I subunit RPA2
VPQGTTYKGRLTVHVNVHNTSTGTEVRLVKSLGGFPIMLQSSLCHLRGKSKEALVQMKEEPDEFGGTFICNGIERVLRLLIQQRRHYIMALRRSAYGARNDSYTEFATMIRFAPPHMRRHLPHFKA